MSPLVVLKKNGIKLTYVARKLGMSESLLRYHLLQPEINKDLYEKFTKVIDGMVQELRKL